MNARTTTSMHRWRGRVAPGIARAPHRRRVPLSWYEFVLTLLDVVELEVLDYPEEHSQVQAVREVVHARYAGHVLPAVEPRELAFVVGLIATTAGSDFLDDGLASLVSELLSPSALAEYEYAKGYRVSPHPHPQW